MKRYLLLIVSCFLLINCQRGIHWDLQSTGSLLKDNDGNCLPVTISGIYVQDSATSADNFITIDVNVTGIGTYNIYTDSLNGIKFSASGEFTNTGIHHVQLLCAGKPANADTTVFPIHYNTSICQATVIIKTNTIPTASFSLQGSPGNCLNDTVIGTFTQRVKLDSSNKIKISVNVLSPGKFSITTNNNNGYSFSASGIFQTTGLQTITMYPEGTPANAGTDTFKITATNSSCNLLVKVNDNAAQFSFYSASGKCMDDTVVGTYVKAIGLDTISKVIISVNVNKPGEYFLTTDTVNGYFFKGAGTLATLGVQEITLYGQGIPINAGTDLFTIKVNAEQCNFGVIVLAGTISVTGSDLIPLTDGSYWNYEDLMVKGRTIKRSIAGDSLANGTTYKLLKEADDYSTVKYLFRRNGDDYFEYGREDKYTGAFQYAKSLYTDLLFAKQYLARNDTWESPEFQKETTFNQVLLLKYVYKCLQANTVVTINGKAFANVYIIEMRPLIRALQNPWGSTNEIYTWYYAKGVGLIYYNAVSNFGYKKAEMQLSTWHVN